MAIVKNEASAEEIPVINSSSVDRDAQWELSFTGFKNKEKRQFLEAGKQGDEFIFPYCARIIKRWPFPYDPADVSSYDELDLEEWAEAFGRIMNGMNDIFRRYVKGA